VRNRKKGGKGEKEREGMDEENDTRWCSLFYGGVKPQRKKRWDRGGGEGRKKSRKSVCGLFFILISAHCQLVSQIEERIRKKR